MKAPGDIVLRRVLVGHRAAVNVVDFDDKYIVSASGDRTIKVCTYYSLLVCYTYPQVWRTSTSEFVRTLHGHRRGIACLQYRGHHVVSGSSDNTIRYVCVRVRVRACACACVCGTVHAVHAHVNACVHVMFVPSQVMQSITNYHVILC